LLIHVFLHALKDSLIILPFLFVVYVLIEFIEQKYVFGLKVKRVLRGKLSPVIGAGVGLIPQCGFSVMATNLFLTKNITLGTLVAVFIATSDEAIPILISNFESIGALLPILGIKLAFAIIAGYFTDLVTAKYQKKDYLAYMEKQTLALESKQNEHTEIEHDHHGHSHEEAIKHDEEEIIGCCNHKIKAESTKQVGKTEWAKTMLLHPLIHSLKVFAFILIITFLFGLLIEWIGEAVLMSFLARTSWYQPLLIGLIGLIPNCASSVIITQMYVLGGIGMGACITGLCVNSGIAVAVLFKKSTNKLGVLLLMLCIYVASVLLGMGLNLLNL
jgi:hypothetical protein